jgi:hypothetical protein
VIATTLRLWVQRHVHVIRTWRARVIWVGVVGLWVAVALTTAVIVNRGPAAAPARDAATATATGSASASASQDAALLMAAAARDQAATWIAGQVAADAIVACDPAMCAVLQQRGLSAGRLVVLGTSAADPLGADVIAATPAVRSQFGTRLENVYAPLTIASFGSGAGRIDVRAMAPDGAVPYRAALAADLRARIAAGRQLARNRRIGFSVRAKAELDAGEVDPRLLLTLPALATGQPVRVIAFGDPSPGASAAVPFRSAEIALVGPPGAAGPRLRSMLTFLDGQRPPFLPARAGLAGASVLDVEYAAPSPLGLLSAP